MTWEDFIFEYIEPLARIKSIFPNDDEAIEPSTISILKAKELCLKLKERGFKPFHCAISDGCDGLILELKEGERLFRVNIFEDGKYVMFWFVDCKCVMRIEDISELKI